MDGNEQLDEEETIRAGSGAISFVKILRVLRVLRPLRAINRAKGLKMNSSVVRPLSSIEDLPLDVIAIITKYFKLKDLAACCAVSHRMREVFGDDILWRRHCDDPDVAEYLRTTACKVEPVFVSPETGDNSNMSPICYWRMAFMREKHLWNNWRQDKFKREVLKGESHHKLSPLILGFLSNDFVMLVTKTKIHILDVRYYPAAEAVEPIDLNFVTQDTFFLRIHGQNNMIVILYLGSVLVYHLEFCTQRSILNYMFLFEDSEKLIPSEYEQALNIRRNQSCNIKMFHLVEGKYFVGILPEVLVIHVWDLEKGIKLKAESLPIDKGSVQAIKGFGTGVVGIAIEDIDESTKIRCFLAFSLTNLCFLPFKKTGTRHDEFYVDKNSIIICRPQTYNMPRCPHLDLLWMWNQLCCTPTPHSPVQPIGNKFVFIHNKDSCLTLVDPDNEYFKLPLVTGIRLYQVLSKRIIQVQRQSGFEVWELDGPWFLKTMAATSGCGRIISVNKASSRCIVILGKVTAVLHYW